MIFHLALHPLRLSDPARLLCLGLLDHVRAHGIECRLYLDRADLSEQFPAHPLSELAFVDDPEDLLVWCYADEAPEIHLAERFPGRRMLLYAGLVPAASNSSREQLRSLSRSFDLAAAIDGQAMEQLTELGFEGHLLWPYRSDGPANGESGVSALWTELLSVQLRSRVQDTFRVSIVVCTWNRADHLESCLLQLQRQRYPRMEVIVVNGPSTDHTEEVLARFSGRIKVRRNPRANLCVSRNMGIAAAAGQIVAFLDDDALAQPEWLYEALAAFDDPLTAAVGGQTFRLRNENIEFANGVLTETAYPWPIQPQPGSHHTGESGLWNTVTGTNCLFRRSVLVEAGGFDERIPYSHDEADVVMRLLRRGFRTRHRPLAIVHHGSQPSSNRRSEFDLHWRVMLLGSIYCGYENRPPHVNRWGFLARTVLEHAKHRFRDPVDWWLQRRVPFGLFLRIQWRVFAGLTEGAFKAVTLPPQRLDATAAAEPNEAWLPWPTDDSPQSHRVVHVSYDVPHLRPTGEGYRACLLAKSLTAEGYVSTMLAHASRAYNDTRNGTSYRFIPEVASEQLPLAMKEFPESARLAARSASAWRGLQELAVRAGARQLVGAVWEVPGLVAACDPRFQTVLVVITPMAETIRIEEQPISADLRIALDLERETVRCARAVVGISAAATADLLRYHELPADRSHIIPVGLPDRAPQSTEPADMAHILYIGPLTRRKGGPILLEAIPRILWEFSDVRFDIIGELPSSADAPEREMWEEWLRTHPIEAKHVAHHGVVSEARKDAILRRCRMLVMPSIYESFGIPAAEAMMFGRPVVATTVGGLPEVVSAEVTGILVPPGEPQAIANAVLRLLRDDILWNRMALSARRRYEDLFTSARTGRDFAALLRELDEEYERDFPLVNRSDGSGLACREGITRWRDPLYGRVHAVLPAGGAQAIVMELSGVGGRLQHRVDLFASLSEPCRDVDPVCDLEIGAAGEDAICSVRFTGAHFGGTRWAVLSSYFTPGGEADLTVAVRNAGFSALRIQRIEVRRIAGGLA